MNLGLRTRLALSYVLVSLAVILALVAALLVFVNGGRPGANRQPPVWSEFVGIAVAATVLITPIGVIFGLIASRGIVRQAEAELTAQNARLAERRRIAEEVHDSLSQELFAMRTFLHGMETRYAGDAELVEHVHGMRTTTTRMIKDMRALLLELRPTTDAAADLESSLTELAGQYSRRVGTAVNTDLQNVQLPADAKRALLNVAREALANAVRHGGAKAISISLSQKDGRVGMAIVDDGGGFSSHASVTGHGLGLTLMRERVESVGGCLRILSTPGKGTTVHAEVPAGSP